MLEITKSEELVAKLIQALERSGMNTAKKIAPDASERVQAELVQTYAYSALKVFVAYAFADICDDVAVLEGRIDRHCDFLYKAD
jgi:hypothetical protein